MEVQSSRVYRAWAEHEGEFTTPKPWSKFAEFYEMDIEKYPNPFLLLTELLQQWPEKTLTAEENADIRMKRLVEAIAGYPLISVGRRPLDFPSHPMSSTALTLSLYVDQIPSPEPKLIDSTVSLGSWYSLRNYVLMCSLDRGDNALEKMTFSIIKTIRDFENQHSKTVKYLPGELNEDERRLLSVLHSSDHNRIKFWPKAETIEDEEIIDFGEFIKLDKLRKDFHKTYYYHEFRFGQIQTWITKWVANTKLYSQKPQNFITGTSVILESLFARIRSLLLRSDKHIGVAGICIDGGGRISYFSKNPPPKERDSLKKFIDNSLLDLKENRLHEHPFMAVITKSMDTYMDVAEELDWFKDIKGESKGQDLFRKLLGNASEWFYPEIHFLQLEKTEDEYKQEFCDHGGSVVDVSKPQYKFPCIICDLKEIKDFKLSSGNCADLCPTHWLIHNIANSSKQRNLSLSHELGPVNGIRTEGFGRPNDVIAIDANSLGTIFKSDFEWRPKLPQLKEGHPLKTIEHKLESELMYIFSSKQESIVDFKRPLNECFDLIGQKDDEYIQDKIFLQNGKEMEPKEVVKAAHKHLRSGLSNLRMAINTRIIRRSFSFNANWSISLRNKVLIGNQRLTPWIAAGDDLILINRILLTPPEISGVLGDFHEDLQSKLPKCHLSFAGGWSKRQEESHGKKNIIDCINEALANEKIAKHAWKELMRKSPKENFSNLVGKKVPCEICSKKGIAWLNDNQKGLHRHEAGGSQPPSITVNFSSKELEELAQNDPMEYTK